MCSERGGVEVGGSVNDSTRLSLSGGWRRKEEKKLEKDYARLWVCKNSRRLREASIVKTVSREINKNKAKIVSMLVSYNEHIAMDLRTS